MHRTQFLNEASLAGKLRHPHIVAILDAVVGEESGHIAMELVTGGDLSQFAKPDKLLPPADVLQIGFKCCGAMDYAYREQGIVHRDLKPANIMISRGTDIKIADFGAAFLKKSQPAQSAAMGSPYYMAPEHIQGHEPTFHSDIYSLGVVLYELLTGRRPFVAENLEALIDKISQTEAAAPSELRPALPREIDAVVLRALKKDPAQRYGTWAQFGVEISKVVAPRASRRAWCPTASVTSRSPRSRCCSSSPTRSSGSSPAPQAGRASKRARCSCARISPARASISSPADRSR